MPRQIGSSPDRRWRSIVQIVVARHSPSSPSEIARRSSRRRLVTEFALAASAFRPPYLATLVLPPSRYFIFLSLFLFDSLSVSDSLSLSLYWMKWKLQNELNSLSLSLSLSLYSLIRLTLSFSLLKFELCLSLAEWTSPLLIFCLFFTFVFLNVLLFMCSVFVSLSWYLIRWVGVDINYLLD